MAAKTYVIGVDFGTLSGRAVLVEADTGYIAGQREAPYPHGVITHLSDSQPLGDGWALQDPADYLWVLEDTIPTLLREAGVQGEQVAGLGCDVTSCTILPALSDGTPLCRLKEYQDHPHAYVKLWKHHSAQPQAQRIEQMISDTAPGLLDRYGGKVSSQWMLPKTLQILEEAPEVYDACDLLLEAVDWLSFQLTGVLRRNTCSAGFKNFWTPGSGYPSRNFLTGLDPRLEELVSQKLRGPMAAPWEAVGYLTSDWASRLGLSAKTVVAAGIIDAHAGVLGCGITEGNRLMMVLGTSSCHMLLSEKEVNVPGICGSCYESVLPGYYAYEAGQACVGDMLDWFIRNAVPAEYAGQARERGISLHQLLSDQAGRLAPGESGLLALDWWNGQRTPLVDDSLTGMILGMTIETTPAEQYRALLEGAAFGAKWILETFEAAGLSVEEIVSCGGIAHKNPLMMQIYADVLGLPIRVSGSLQCAALGASVLAATAAGLYQTPVDAVKALTVLGSTIYRPVPNHAACYQELYHCYRAIAAFFGSGSIMKELSALRRRTHQRKDVN